MSSEQNKLNAEQAQGDTQPQPAARSKARGSLPKLVLVLVNQYDAWIVGGAADPEQTSPRDYDVVVPFYHWPSVAHLIVGYVVTLNSLGGWKCLSDNCEVDVWPGDLGWVMCHQAAKWAWQPRYGIRLRKETNNEQAYS